MTKSFRIGAILALVVCAVVEGLSYVCLLLLPRFTGIQAPRTKDIYAQLAEQTNTFLAPAANRREVFDPELGWLYRAGFSRAGDRINAQGTRSLRDYRPTPPSGVTRVAAFGDSFTYDTEVEVKDAWSTVVEREYPMLEVLNYGVGAYGNDQAYLRFLRDGESLAPDIVMLGFTPDDVRRLTSVYRKFIDDREFAMTKPRYHLDSAGRLVLQRPIMRDTADIRRVGNDPKSIRAFGKTDQWYEPAIYENPLYDVSATVRLLTVLGVRIYNKYFDANRLFDGTVFNPRSEGFRLQLAITERFVRDVRASGRRPVFVIFPDRPSVLAHRAGRTRVYAALADSLRKRDIDVIDGIEAFSAPGKLNVDLWFRRGGHYSPVASEMIARVIGRELLVRAKAIPNAPSSPMGPR